MAAAMLQNRVTIPMRLIMAVNATRFLLFIGEYLAIYIVIRCMIFIEEVNTVREFLLLRSMEELHR